MTKINVEVKDKHRDAEQEGPENNYLALAIKDALESNGIKVFYICVWPEFGRAGISYKNGIFHSDKFTLPLNCDKFPLVIQ